jgi:LacI family transcriptional regulator
VDRPPIQYDSDTVLVDNEGGARMAVKHLIYHGHRRIAFIGDRLDVYTTRLRYQGFRGAMLDAGIAVDERLSCVDAFGPQKSTAAMMRLLELDNGPTAVLSANSRTSLGVVQALHHCDRTDIAHVCFDDLEVAESLNPPITAVSQDPQRLGQQATTLLFDRLNGEVGPPRRVVLPVRLIVRGSGELRPPDSTLSGT